MFCPVCKTVELVMADRQGTEIDHCPTCRGVWLDRGELDKLIERSVQLMGSGPAPAASSQIRSRSHDKHQGFKDSAFGHKDHGRSQHGQHRSFWRELFD